MPHLGALFTMYHPYFSDQGCFLNQFFLPLSPRDMLSVALRISGFHSFDYEVLIKYGNIDNVTYIQITSIEKLYV